MRSFLLIHKALALFLCTGFALSLQAQVQFSASHLPIVIIETDGRTIPDEDKVNVRMKVIDRGPGLLNHLSDPPNGYNGIVGIELRGNTSQGYEKKAYDLETRDSQGEDLAVSLMGMPEEADWALIAPLNDKTLMRDVLAYTWAARAMPWAPRTRYCELVLDGDYKGVYVLLESIKRDNNRVDLPKAGDSGDALSGGYILRMDKPSASGPLGDWKSAYAPAPGAWQETWFQHFYPKSADISPAQAAYIRDYITRFEDMLMQSDYSKRYPDWIERQSWIDYLLLQELTKNTDAFRLSSYFYKQRDSRGGKLFMGPVWDFNISLGIGDYCEGQNPAGWIREFNEVCPDDRWLVHFWWEKLWQDSTFRQQTATRWRALRAGPWRDERLLADVDSLASRLGEARIRNFQRWPVIGTYIWPNAFVGNSYEAELQYLKQWLLQRTAWLDAQMPEPALPLASTDQVVFLPNPAKGSTRLALLDPKAANLLVSISLTDLHGRKLFELKDHAYNGPIPLELQLPAGLYLCKVTVPNTATAWQGKLVVY